MGARRVAGILRLGPGPFRVGPFCVAALRQPVPGGGPRAPFSSVTQVAQPLLLLVGDEFHPPGQRLGPRAGHAGVDERVQDLALLHPQTRHHRDAEGGEQQADITAPCSPGYGAVESLFRLPGDTDARLTGLFPPGLDARPVGRSPILFVGLTVEARLGQPADDDDLVPVDPHLWRLDEPVVGDAPRQPGDRFLLRQLHINRRKASPHLRLTCQWVDRRFAIGKLAGLNSPGTETRPVRFADGATHPTLGRRQRFPLSAARTTTRILGRGQPWAVYSGFRCVEPKFVPGRLR